MNLNSHLLSERIMDLDSEKQWNEDLLCMVLGPQLPAQPPGAMVCVELERSVMRSGVSQACGCWLGVHVEQLDK